MKKTIQDQIHFMINQLCLRVSYRNFSRLGRYLWMFSWNLERKSFPGEVTSTQAEDGYLLIRIMVLFF